MSNVDGTYDSESVKQNKRKVKSRFSRSQWYIGIVKLTILPKLKLLGNGEFNHLIINLTLPLTCEPKFPLNKWGPNK